MRSSARAGRTRRAKARCMARPSSRGRLILHIDPCPGGCLSGESRGRTHGSDPTMELPRARRALHSAPAAMLDLLNPLPPPARVLSIRRVLPLLLALLTLFFLEMSAEVQAPTAQPLPTPPPKTRLVMFWIDSLSTSDMAAPGRLTRLKARLPTALHGPVRECMDAVSVPCMTAASTGLDRFSLFAMVRNFGGAGARTRVPAAATGDGALARPGAVTQDRGSSGVVRAARLRRLSAGASPPPGDGSPDRAHNPG